MSQAQSDDETTPVDNVWAGVTVEERERLEEIIGLALDAAAREAGKTCAELGLDCRQIITHAVFNAYRLGRQTRRSGSGVIETAKDADPKEPPK